MTKAVKFQYFTIIKRHYENREPIDTPFSEVHGLLKLISELSNPDDPNDRSPRGTTLSRNRCTILDHISQPDSQTTVGRFSTAQSGTPTDLVDTHTFQSRQNTRTESEGEEQYVYFAVHTSPEDPHTTTLILQNYHLDGFNANTFKSFLSRFARQKGLIPGFKETIFIHELGGENFFVQLNNFLRVINLDVIFDRTALPASFFSFSMQEDPKDVVRFSSTAKPNGDLKITARRIAERKYRLNDQNIRSIIISGTDRNGNKTTVNTNKLLKIVTVSIQTMTGTTLIDPAEVYRTLTVMATSLP